MKNNALRRFVETIHFVPLLRITIFSGLMLLVIFGLLLAGANLGGISTTSGGQEDRFQQLLVE